MELSSDEQKRLFEKAEQYGDGFIPEVRPQRSAGYYDGAEAEATRAAALVKALEEIKDMIRKDYLNNGNNQLATNINMEIGIALANYNKQA